ncbi:hypothetical protein BLL40_14125 [Domibacillus mangrovi]|uniref:Uncharacterized protein n=1 Tax=Domibacillus mangrovi TaxID=1714354 RepID=A0A1Q5P0L9_9BACI|nr:hypothetical protein BLL40_14125 [Domibacillus mangrovi]
MVVELLLVFYIHRKIPYIRRKMKEVAWDEEPIEAMIFIPHQRAVRPPLQDFEKKRRISEGSTARKSPIGSTNIQWGMKKTPTE